MSFMKKNAGFTLVELIVVIAILGILATVAIPSYNGYIEKAQIAGDQQELHNLNLAFIAACAEEGESNIGRNDVSVNLNAGKAAVTIGNADIAENFAEFYPAADAGEFKYATKLGYNSTTGSFEMDNSSAAMNQTGYRKEYADAAKDYYESENSYKGNEVALVDTVNQFSNAFADFLDSPSRRENLLSDPTFAEFCETNGIDTTSNEMLSKAMILYAAQELSDVKPSAIHAGLVNSYNKDTNRIDMLDMIEVMNGGEATPAEMAVDGAALAAVIAGYANSSYATPEAKEYFTQNMGTAQDVDSLFGYLNGVIDAGDAAEGKGFAAYLNSSQSVTDIEAFTGGLGAVHHGSGDVMGAYASGATNDELNALLGQILYGQWTGAEG